MSAENNGNTYLDKKYTNHSGLVLAITSCASGIAGIILGVISAVLNVVTALAVAGNGDASALLTVTTIITSASLIGALASLTTGILAVIKYVKAKKSSNSPTATIIIAIFGIIIGIGACIFAVCMLISVLSLFAK